ncbi:MAG: hypothetical protein AABZ32_11245 [Bacteroidota bacterium]
MTLHRTYKSKDVDMLTACATIIEQAIIHKMFLISKRVTWADPFLTNIQTRIASAFPNFLGIDNAQEMRDATQIVLILQEKALYDLAELKVQIEEDFKNNKTRLKEILTRLGFIQHHKPAQRHDQEALVELLLKFAKNMTPALQTEITNAGTSSPLIRTIIQYANALKNANIIQETFKGSRKVISASAVKEFNEIYSQVISIAKISANFFKNDQAIKDKFSYKKTINNLNQPPPPPTPAI